MTYSKTHETFRYFTTVTFETFSLLLGALIVFVCGDFLSMLIGIFFCSNNTATIKTHPLQIHLKAQKKFFIDQNHKKMIKTSLFFFAVDVCFSHVCKIINKDKNMMVALLDGTKNI
ncbi:hypothetical protein FYK26_24695 (plasmid) [Escherichia albertii]|nr:hypothetical protein FYK30_24670 [Escherichia albertii]QSZ91865.1 hypothetical protein FYK29_24680 [Escherichia albertii]QSZ96280.1 hypothetical protein FYK28_24715 [Escherichia albertii]QTA00706.1 hypothetical protein FYK27_24950 [Escherichia albertii]QTA05067.1 hypothetical protein FYK26_24695 [Escherichia albertii]